MTAGEVITLIAALASAASVIVTILKVFKSITDKNDENTKLLVSTHKDYAAKHVDLTREVLGVVNKNTEAFKENARSNDGLIQSTAEVANSNKELKKTLENLDDKILQNLLNSRGGKT